MLNIRLGMHKSKGCNKSKIDLKENHFLIKKKKKKHTSKYDRFKNKPTVFCSCLWSVRVCLWKYAALKLCWPCDLHWLEYIVEIMLGKFQSLGLLRPYGFHIWLSWDIVLKLTCKGASPIYCGFRNHQWFRMETRRKPQLQSLSLYNLSGANSDILDQLFLLLTVATWISLSMFNSRSSSQPTHKLLRNTPPFFF